MRQKESMRGKGVRPRKSGKEPDEIKSRIGIQRHLTRSSCSGHLVSRSAIRIVDDDGASFLP